MSDRPIPFNVPYRSGNELGYLKEAIESNHLAGDGPFTKRVQHWLEDRFSVGKVLLTHSCTGALELAALALGIGPGDEVIVPSYTFSTTASAFMRTGARIVFADVDPSSMNVDPMDVERKMTGATRAIVAVHYAGVAADLNALSRIASEHGVLLIEDAAQGLASTFEGEWLGTIGKVGAISFHETKNLHSGLGGALFLNDLDLVDRTEDIWERGTNRAKFFRGLVDKYTWVELGSSFYPSELQAAFLLAQLEALDENLAHRSTIYLRYHEMLTPLASDGLVDLPRVGDGRTVNYHAVYIVLPSVTDTDIVRRGLLNEGIHAFIGYVPLHSSPMGASLGYVADDLPMTNEFAYRVLRLPIHQDMRVSDVDRVVAAIVRALEAGGSSVNSGSG